MEELTFESAIKESVESACEKTPGMVHTKREGYQENTWSANRVYEVEL